jgi:NAD(P)H-hydrate epimerase
MDPLDMMVADFNAEYLGISRLSLMENAGRAIAYQIFDISEPAKVIIFSGSGGNGGDGFVAARYLLNQGFKVEIILLTSPSNIKSKEAAINWNVLENMIEYIPDLKINICLDSSKINSLIMDDNDIIVDAILGTGIKGNLKEPVRSAIEIINNSNSIKIAIDIPSGLDPLTGDVKDISVIADYTITFHKAKKGLKIGPPRNIGQLIISDIGIPKIAEVLLGPGDILRLKSRDQNAHKGGNGRVLIVGGSKEYSGAPALAGMAALSAGVDLVTIICPDSAAIPIKSYSPDLIVIPVSGDYINLGAVDTILGFSKKADCILLGCGIGESNESYRALNTIVKNLGEHKSMVIDADALKMVDKEIVKNYEDLIITPHMGEFEAFFGEISSVKLLDLSEKITAFHSLSQQIKGTVLLKGKVDMIFNGRSFRLNKTGSPGMTVGGTGDCLAGLVAALRSQGHSSWDSACLATFINGRAGEFAEKKWGYGFKTSQMIQFLNKSMKHDF